MDGWWWPLGRGANGSSEGGGAFASHVKLLPSLNCSAHIERTENHHWSEWFWFNLISFGLIQFCCHLIWLPSWSVLQTSRPIRGLGDTGSSVGCGEYHHFDWDLDDNDGDCHVHQDEIAHLRFWRDVEAKETGVPVVVAALLVLVDLLLKHSHSLSPTSSSPPWISWSLTVITKTINNITNSIIQMRRFTFQTTMTASPSLSTAFFSVSSFTPWFQIIIALFLNVSHKKDWTSIKGPRVGIYSLYEGHLLWRLHLHLLRRLILILRKTFNWTHFTTLTL